MNEYDSDKMADVLHASDGLTLTDRPEDADVILFNTCSVREKAQERVFHDLGRVRELKLANPDLVIGVGGCVASQEGAAIVRRAPYVDVVFGPQTLHRLPQLIAAAPRHRPRAGRHQLSRDREIRPPAAAARGGRDRRSCRSWKAAASTARSASCPYTRGEEVSRPFDDVLTEIADLADQGVMEITLLGQNVNAYRGRDGRVGMRKRAAKSPTSRRCSNTSRKSRASSASATRRRIRRK